MKAKISVVIAIIVMAFAAIAATPILKSNSLSSSKKTTDTFSFIRTHRAGRGAVVSWAFSGVDASSFTVQRTNDDPADPFSVWVEVGTCSCNGSRSYKVSDASPIPGIVNYRVIALLTDGSTMTSDVSTIKIMSH